VGITNAINLIDGLDGLAAGISAVIAILGIHSGDAIMTVLMLALLGSLTGFLLFNFEQAELHFRRAEDFDKWWQAVCIAAEKLEFTTGLLTITNRDGTERKLSWNNNGQKLQEKNVVKATLPVRDRRKTGPLHLTIQTYPNGSLESAGRRMTLFGRLIEEYSIANLNGKSKADKHLDHVSNSMR